MIALAQTLLLFGIAGAVFAALGALGRVIDWVRWIGKCGK